MGLTLASASVDVHNLLLNIWIVKSYNSWITEGRYKYQPSKYKKHSKQSKHLPIS
jgi:hypothetical protein